MQKARRLLPSLLVLFGVLISTQALATVVQVDGTVVPTTDSGSSCDGNIQVCLNDSEGDNNIDAITDAATEPEVFFPNTTQPVEFRDVGEGAGFENSFGYYNIGDDVTDVSNLHPILGCGVEASDHSAEANGYVENAEPGDTTTVDFAAEETAGRYKGGAIGFYLITPEISNGSRGSPNCGDFETSGGDAYFGRMYFTQRDLNNDGDFVHHLVYQSNQAEDRFYFGFEDLFRGGDNDFEDMLIRVTGLTPPCVPEPEICDGLDNDCDNQIDEEDSLVDTGNECTDTSALGICQAGETICIDGSLECASVVPPEDEVCDNIDNDCDGTVDNSPIDVGGSCDSGDVDFCSDDTEQCVSGALVCADVAADPADEFVEVCNNQDDDCDGNIDEGTDGDSCDGSDGDLCPEGMTVCDGGTLLCTDDTAANPEVCDGVDNDCDGATDDDPIDAGEACSRGVGACLRNGATECVSGELTCNASAGAAGTETCDGSDEDCDGSIDEDFNLGADCVAPGACGPGIIECFGGGSICSSAPGGSNDQSSTETCNGIDDDCDGSTDEGLTDLGECGTDIGECSPGVLQCVGGEEQCRGASDGSPEECDGLDNDCDGTADNNLTDTGDRCSDSGKFDIGACVAGQTACVDGTLECQNQTDPSPEVCNAEDDDCDGSVDEEPSDVGEECVKGDGTPSNVGVCQPGETICVNGSIQCNGDVGPGTEVCNGEDDDCNGEVDDDPVDAGRVCGSGLGTCEPGVLICNAEGELECDGATQGEEEVCNGIDDDCDNVVDEDPSDAGAECGNDVGVCEMGAERCISGELECVGGTLPGTEVCNGLDDDCNGEIDDGELCEGGVCTDGRCSNPCDPSAEFPCPPGQICSSGGYCVPNPCSEVECEPMEDGTGTRCVEGDCIPICDVPSMSCPDPYICRRTDGACVGNNCTYLPYLCDETQICRAGECVEDRCRDVTCDDGQFCRDGECVGSCAGVTCEGSERCQDGECVATGCDAPCGSREVCDASSGECVDDPCRAIVCGEDQSCDPQTGTCTTDPCLGIECPEEQVCRMGQCLAEDGPVGGTGGTGGSSGAGGAGGGGVDAGARVDVVATGGGGFGCSVAARGGGDSAATCAWLALASLALLALRRRRARSSRQGALHRAGVFTLAIGTLAAAQPGCSVDPFCVDNCGDGDGIDRGDGGPGGAGMGGGSGMGGSGADGGAGFGGSVGDAGECEPTLVDDENCNGRDDDCDGLVDESFKLQEDPANCGACGNSCAKPGAQTVCDQGTCVIMGCFGGYVDLNDDTMNVDDFDGSDGCEYECFTSNQGEEVCDELDNDCDGTVDEGTDLQTDPQNCGQCGRTCEFFHASGRCAEGSCTFDPMVDCDPGFVDANGVEFDGCEFECEPTNEGEEICDSVDNDCDGMVDEDFNLDSNPDRCGACDRTCEFPNATPQCTDGECGFDPTTDCEAGYSDTDGNQINGCEDDCIPTDDPTEICDGVDNDCDGTIDGDTTDSGDACHLAPGDTAAGACTSTGTITCVNSEDEEGDLIGELKCVGAPEPTTEICNGADDDCDGTIDENPSDEGRVCEPPLGICSAGFTACDTGTPECVRDVGPQPETCNGLDDDCDGTIDNNLTDPSLGTSCGTNEGPCSAGTVECVDGALVCEGAVFGSAETCNGVDDDCNGSVDDNPIDDGGSCGSNVGACVPGSLVCSGGGLVCSGGVQSSAETCNGADDDCDGAVDENAAGSGPLTRDCYTGPAGTDDEPFCQGGTQACTNGDWGACADEQTPVDETCDGDDTDCDGTIDENITRSCYTGPDGTQGVGICTAGTETCSAGSFGSCEGEVLPEATESCDGEDDDCDEAVDENDAGTGPLTRDCYTGPDGTEDVGTCQGGTQTCRVGAFRDCIGEITPVTDVCGDGADTDCDGDGDAAEGCATEETDQRLDDSGAHSFDVRMAVAGSPHGKHVYVVWVDRASGEPDIYFSRSTDGGGNFTNPRNLTNSDSSSDIGDFSHSAVQPRIAAAYDPGLGDDRVYIAFQLVDGNDNRHVRIGYSSDSGGTFADSGYLDQSNGTDNFKHELAIGVEGEHVALVWERLDLSDLDRNVVVRASEDAGNSWTDEQVVNDGSGSDPVAGKPRIGMTSGNRVVIAWREVRAPDSTFDVFARYGDFDGSSLLSVGSELQVSEDSGDNRESDDLQMRVSGSHVYLVWQDLSTGGSGGFDQDSDIVFARSTDGSAAYGGEVILDDPGNEVSSSFAPTLAVDGGSPDRVFVAWVDTRLGSQIFFTGSSDDGASFTTPVRASSDAGQPISGSTRAPRMAFAGGDMIVIAYENGPTGSPSHIYAAQSIDGGMSWHYDDPQLDTGAGPAITPAIGAIDDGSATTGAAVTWVDYRRNGSDGDIYGARAVR